MKANGSQALSSKQVAGASLAAHAAVFDVAVLNRSEFGVYTCTEACEVRHLALCRVVQSDELRGEEPKLSSK